MKNRVMWAIVGAVLIGAGAGYAAQTLPCLEGFEAPPSADWTVVGGTYNSASKLVGDLGLQLDDGSLTVDVDESATYNHVWFHVLSKPAVYEADPTVPADTAAAFFLRNDGVLCALDGAAWAEAATGIAQDAWLGFVVHLDYEAGPPGTWDLYVKENPTGEGDRFTRVAAGLEMNTTATKLDTVEITTGLQAYLDKVGGSVSYRTVATGEANVLARDLPAAGASEQLAPNPGTHEAGEDKLTEALGADLVSGLDVGDQIKMYPSSVAGTPNIWTLAAKAPTLVWNDTVDAASAVDILPEEGAWIVRHDSAPDALAFMTYDSVIAPTPDASVGGTGDPSTLGWNQLAWPHADEGPNDSSHRLGFSGTAGQGDLLYLYEGGRYIRLWWNGSRWRQGGGEPSVQMRQGQGFWYRRRAEIDGTWNVDLN